MERADAAGGSACRWLCLAWQDLSKPVEGCLRDHRHALERTEILRPARQTSEGVLTMTAGSTKVVRCAIYTRVSTDQGLEQDFNSLDAQVFWPFLLGDIFSYALWPYDYYYPFWSYGTAYDYDYG